MSNNRFYTIKELTIEVNRTAATLYNYMRSNPDFFKAHRQERSKGGYVYDEEALNCLKNQYGVSVAVPVGEEKEEEPANPQTDPPPSPDIEALQQELEAEKAKNQALQADFDKANGEIDGLKRENGFKNEEIQRLLLIIQQEKQEKAQIMLMLPPPRKTIGEKIKALFTRKDVRQ